MYYGTKYKWKEKYDGYLLKCFIQAFVMKGKLFGIGVGPGDPELLTIKAVKTMGACDVIAAVASGEERMAFDMVKEYVNTKQIYECPFSKESDQNRQKAQRLQIIQEIEKFLDDGKSVGFITLGDPTIYSTYMYIHDIIGAHGYQTEIISGITSFIAAAAAINDSLCVDEQPLHIIPAGYIYELDDVLKLNGTKVLMKSSRNINNVLDKLKKSKYRKISLVERCAIEGQRIIHDIGEVNIQDLKTDYLSIIIVKE